ncbi:MAG: hypothetical protein KA383_15170 [Phycisphaerae bacterium]|jgi:hypothetical protein|nr:hypothetical protein [Phycisphaerae bacterium]HQL53682.1 hypothetical protein [Phycisphaerae bacterium]
MKMRTSALVVALASLSVLPGVALADVYTDLGAIHNTGYAPAGISGQIISGPDGTGYMLNPFVDYSYTTPATNPPLAGDFVDYEWVHETNSGPTSSANATIWQFGARGTDFLLVPAIDHAPVPHESLEATLWGSDNGGATWVKGTLVEVYDLGMTPAVTEDWTSRWVFSYPVDLVGATTGLAQNQYYFYDGDTEIDTVLAVPEPASAALALLGVLLLRRSR